MSEMKPKYQDPAAPFSGYIFLIALLALNAWFLSWNMLRCFNFLDMGSVIDTSWRILVGHRPYVDFIYWPSPLHLYINAFFYKLFGFGKLAMYLHLVLVHSAVICLVFFLLRKRVPWVATFTTTLLTVPSFYWSISHPWHDQNAHFFGLLAIAALIWQTPFTDRKRAFFIGMFCGLMATLSVFTKMNLGAAYGLVLFLVLSVSAQKAESLCGFIGGIGAGLGVMAVLIRFPAEYFEQFSQLVGSEGEKRLLHMLDVRKWLINGYFLPVVFVSLGIFKDFWKRRELAALFCGVTFIAIFSANTGGMITQANNILWGVQMALAWLMLYQGHDHGRRLWKIARGALFTLTLIWAALSFSYGIKMLAWTYVRHNPIGDYTIKTKPFDGWRCTRMEGELLDAMAADIKRNVPAGESFLIFPSMTILYALTGHEPYRGMPYIFLDDVLPPDGEQRDQVRERILNDLPTWMLVDLGSLRTAIPFLGIEDVVLKRYVPVKQWKIYILLRKKP